MMCGRNDTVIRRHSTGHSGFFRLMFMVLACALLTSWTHPNPVACQTDPLWDALPPRAQELRTEAESLFFHFSDGIGFDQDLTGLEQCVEKLTTALRLTEEGLGQDHPAVARVLNHLAVATDILEEGHEFADLEKRLDEEEEDPDAAWKHFEEDAVEHPYLPLAIPLFERAASIAAAALGEEHPLHIEILHNQASVHSRNYMTDEAKQGYEQVKTRITDLSGHDDPLYETMESWLSPTDLDPSYLGSASGAQLLNFWGARLAFQKQRPAAILYFKRAIAIDRAKFPDEPWRSGADLNWMASLHEELGDFEHARKLYEEALELARELPEPLSGADAQNLYGLAFLDMDAGRFDEEEDRLEEALKIMLREFGEIHIETANALAELAEFHLRRDETKKSITLWTQALDVVTELGARFDVPWLQHGLARSHLVAGETGLAVSHLESAFRKRKENWPGLEYKENPGVGLEGMYETYAAIAQARDDPSGALEYLRRAVDLANNGITDKFTTTEYDGAFREDEIVAAVESERDQIDRAISLHLSFPDSLELAEFCYDLILARKGRSGEEVAGMAHVLRSLAHQGITLDQAIEGGVPDVTVGALLDMLGEARDEMSTRVFTGPAEGEWNNFADEVLVLRQQIDGLEREVAMIARADASLGVPPKREKIQSLIPANAVLIEFLRYSPHRPKAGRWSEMWGEDRYVAYLIKPTGLLSVFDVGEAAEIDGIVTAFVQRIKEARNDSLDTIKSLGTTLYRKLLHDILSSCDNVEHLLISPDSTLNLLPFTALVDDDGSFLIESKIITLLDCGRDLLQIEKSEPSRSVGVILAGPDYDAEIKRNDERSHGNEQRRVGNVSGVRWPQLPGAAKEGQAIAAIVPNADVISGPAATEARLKEVAGPAFVHLATHGFFYGTTEESFLLGRRGVGRAHAFSKDGLLRRFTMDPMLRSGIVLAGANHSDTAGSDGVLTAMEAAGLDLLGTRLVTLSACETGIGEIQAGQGVYGLRRALSTAGAETLVLSLWKIHDEGSKYFMESFYEELLAGSPRGDALRRAGLHLRESERWSHPYYWSAFVLTGDWRHADLTLQ